MKHLEDRPFSYVVNLQKFPISEAPIYDANTIKVLKIRKAIVVEKGTQSGKCTLDLQCSDKEGKQYLILTTQGIIESIMALMKSCKD